MKPFRVPRVEIAGGIASGKTTLASLVTGRRLSAAFENFHANPFWKSFYSDPHKYSFETEITFVLQHYHAIKTPRRRPVIICDFSFLLDKAYAELNLLPSQRKIFSGVLNHIAHEVGEPILLVELQCDPKTEFKRIRKRSRVEERSVSIEYLTSLNQMVHNLIAGTRRHIKVLTIDSSSIDFASDAKMRALIREQVLTAIESTLG